MSPVLEGKPKPPPPTGPARVLYRGPRDLVERIDQAASQLNLSRNEAMTQLLRFAIDEHEKESKRARGKDATVAPFARRARR